MPLTTEQRIELLKKAREAKKAKQEERKAEKINNPPPRGRPKKEATATKKTLDITEPMEAEVPDEEIEEIIENVEEKIMPKPNIPKRTTKKKETEVEATEVEPEVIEVVETRRIKKPKRRIVRKIIKEQYDSESTEEEIEEVIYTVPKYKSIQAKAKEIEKPRPPTPPEIKQQSKPTLNIFGY